MTLPAVCHRVGWWGPARGWRQVLDLGGGAESFLRRVFDGPGSFEPGSPEELAEQWLRSSDADPVALLHVLDSVVARRWSGSPASRCRRSW